MAEPLRAQPMVRFPQSDVTAYQSGTFAPGTGIATPAPAASGTMSAPAIPPSAGTSLGAPAFDPYSATPGVSTPPPTFNAAPPAGTPYPPTTPSPYGSPYGSPPPGAAYPPGSYPPGAVPGTTPSSLYPNGWNTNPAWTNQVQQMYAQRLFTPRARYTYVDGGNSADDLGINDFDVSVAAAFPNWLPGSQPVVIAPAFSLHLWDGPTAPLGDLPPSAYSAYLDVGWSSDAAQPTGVELGMRLGVFTDFNTFNSNSFRYLGQALVRIRCTPTSTFRGGVIYLDRNDIKMLPAIGILWTPNDKTRFDIFFPRPKLAQHMTTTGNQSIWWYVAGEYGGGAWTIERAAGFSDRVDINDIRLIAGLEWGPAAELQNGKRKGFFEAGWVTDRQLVYVVTPEQSFSLSDSFMLRIGWNY